MKLFRRLADHVSQSPAATTERLFNVRWAHLAVWALVHANPLTVAMAQPGRTPAQLTTIEDSITPEPRVRGFASVVGVMVAHPTRSVHATVDAWLLLPNSEKDVLAERICLTARSRDGRLRYRGEVTLGKQSAAMNSDVLLRASPNQSRDSFLRGLGPGELSLLSEVRCGETSAGVSELRTFVALDPSSTTANKREPAQGILVMLNASERNVQASYASATSKDAMFVRCQNSTAPDATAFNVECQLPLPPSERATVVIRRARPLDSPLEDRFVLLTSLPK